MDHLLNDSKIEANYSHTMLTLELHSDIKVLVHLIASTDLDTIAPGSSLV